MDVINTKTWVVVADSAGAKIYSWHHARKHLDLVQEVAHPEGREAPSEYLDFQHGSYTAGDTRGNYSPHTDLKDAENNRFAVHLLNILEAASGHHTFDDLILIAGPRFHGMLDKHMHAPLKKKVSKNVMKDYMHLSDKELAEKILEA